MTTTLRFRARRTTAALAIVTLAVTPMLAGCFSGPAATTTVQSGQNSGNGQSAKAGDLSVENATLVLGENGSATLIGSVFNAGGQDDRILAVTINGTPAVVTPGSELIPANGGINYGYDGTHYINTYTLQVEPSAFVPVTMQFQNAGSVEMSVMTVPPTGIYEGIAPNPSMG